jgi:hypothetical protein
MQALDRADQASSSSGSFGSGSGPVKIFSFRELQYQAMQAEEMRSQWGITKTAYGMIRFTVEKFFDLPGQEFQRKNRVYYGCAKPRESANSAGGAASFLQSLAKTAVNSSPSKRQALDKGAYAARTETTSNVQRYCGAKTEAKAKPLQMQTTASTAASNDHEVGPGTGSSASASSASGAASSTSAMTPDVYQATFTGFSPSIAPSLDELLAIDPEDPNNWWICKHHHVLDSAIPHMRTTFVLIDQSPSALKQMQMQEAFSSGAAGSSDSDARRGTLSNQKMTVGTENLEDANPHRIRATVFEDAASLIWKKDYPGQAYYDEVEDVADVDNSIKHVDESWIKAVHTTPITMKAKLTIKFKVDRTGNIAPTEIEMLLLNEVRKA